jgi:hypothetical protein
MTKLYAGAGLAFGPNAQKALAVIGIGDALERVSQDTSPDSDLWYASCNAFVRPVILHLTGLYSKSGMQGIPGAGKLLLQYA